MLANHRALIPAALVAILLSIGCGTDCQQLAQEYSNELPNALACDPNSSADQCNDVIGVPNTYCKVSANPANDAKLKDIYSRFQSAGCQAPATFIGLGCLNVVDRCQVNSQGQGACL
jgi:hypothetical protein